MMMLLYLFFIWMERLPIHPILSQILINENTIIMAGPLGTTGKCLHFSNVGMAVWGR